MVDRWILPLHEALQSLVCHLEPLLESFGDERPEVLPDYSCVIDAQTEVVVCLGEAVKFEQVQRRL